MAGQRITVANVNDALTRLAVRQAAIRAAREQAAADAHAAVTAARQAAATGQGVGHDQAG